MGFALWGKLEFNQRDGFLDCRMVTGSAAAGWLVKSIFFSCWTFFRELQRARLHREHPEFVDNQLASNHIRNQFLIGIQRWDIVNS